MIDDSLVSIKQQNRSFSKTEKKSNHIEHMKDFSITRGSHIFRIRSGIFWLKNYVNNNLLFWKLFWR